MRSSAFQRFVTSSPSSRSQARPAPGIQDGGVQDGVHEMSDLEVGCCSRAWSSTSNFGKFVDIGVHQDGLVHVSQLADRFVKDPREVESGRHREGQGRRRRPETPHRPDDEAESGADGRPKKPGRRDERPQTAVRGQSARTPPPDKERRAPRCSGDVDGGRVRQDLEARGVSGRRAHYVEALP